MRMKIIKCMDKSGGSLITLLYVYVQVHEYEWQRFISAEMCTCLWMVVFSIADADINIQKFSRYRVVL